MLNMRREEVQLIAKDRESIRRHVLIILGISIASAVLFLSLLVWFDLKEYIGPFAVAISSAIWWYRSRDELETVGRRFTTTEFLRGPILPTS